MDESIHSAVSTILVKANHQASTIAPQTETENTQPACSRHPESHAKSSQLFTNIHHSPTIIRTTMNRIVSHSHSKLTSTLPPRNNGWTSHFIVPFQQITSSLIPQPSSHSQTFNNNSNNQHQNKLFSTITRGQDLLAESLTHGSRRKIILDSYYPQVGVDVIGMVEYQQPQQHQEQGSDDSNDSDEKNFDNHKTTKTLNEINQRNNVRFNNNNNNHNDEENNEFQPQNLLMNSSIIAFPHSCFLWNDISNAKDVTIESLSIIELLKPSIEFLFIGCDTPLPPRELNKIKKYMKDTNGIVVEQMDVMNAMGTFNILNGEDRRVAVALVVDVDKKMNE